MMCTVSTRGILGRIVSSRLNHMMAQLAYELILLEFTNMHYLWSFHKGERRTKHIAH